MSYLLRCIQEPANHQVIKYTYSSAATSLNPINVANLGPLVPCDSYDASTEGAYRAGGIFRGAIDTAITISQGDRVWYNTATNKFTNTKPTAGYLFGRAVAAGTAAAGYVDVELVGPFSGRPDYAASGAAPAAIIAFKGSTSLITGSGTLETIPVTGCLSTDTVDVWVSTAGSTQGWIKESKIVTDGSISVTTVSNSGSGAVFAYNVYRAVA